MDKVISTLVLLNEMLLILQCLQITFMQKLRIDKYVVGIIIVNLIVYTGINYKIIPAFTTCIFYVTVYIFCYYKFKLTMTKTAFKFIMAFSLDGCIEGIVAFITNVFRRTGSESFILFLSSFVAFIFAWIIWKCLPLLSNNRIISNKGMLGMVIFYGLLFVCVLIAYYLHFSVGNIYVVCALIFLAIAFSCLYRLEQARVEIEKKNYELKLQKVYGGAYEELLAEVRRRQHDYKNQLGAIYSMHLTAGSLEELVNMQKKYADILKEDCKMDSILTGCGNSILAGYIYHKCSFCSNEGVAVDYSIHTGQVECCFAIHEMIEILGILIDNACESVLIQKRADKRIRLEMKEEEKIIISVSNPTEYIPFSEIENMFVCGYSSKGENRGIGLSRVKELANKYEANIKVSNFWYDEENWINFTVEIVK